MNKKFVLAKLANRPPGPSLLPLNTALMEARRYSPPDNFTPHVSLNRNEMCGVRSKPTLDEQLASSLIEKLKKQHRRPSPFASWMGQPFPQEYEEMVAADVKRENG